MLKYLIVILDHDAPSFCYYKTRHKSSKKKNIISLTKLKAAINLAKAQDLSINFLGMNSSLPETHLQEINKFENYAKFIPIEEDDEASNSILILNSDKKNIIKNMKDSAFRNIILRLEKEHLKDFKSIIKSLLHKCKRLNLCLLDLHSYDKDDLKSYKSQLDEIGDVLVSEYKASHPIEFSFITDRMLIKEMNNCNAGIEHITVGPDGNFYICPGFFHNMKDNNAGNLKDGIKILNNQLLQIDHAPICSICDAFHCKRCIYYNKTATLEVNTPSYQQCAASHLERDTSRMVLTQLSEIEPFNEMPPVEELDYIDPLLLLTGKVKKKNDRLNPVQRKPEKKAQPKPEDDFIIVKQKNKMIKLPRLKQVVPQSNTKNTGNIQLKNKTGVGDQQTNELDTKTTKGLLLEILRTQKQILAVLKKEFGGK